MKGTAKQPIKGSIKGAYKHSVVILILCLVPILASCGATSEMESPDILRVGLESRPKTLDPRYATDATGQRISHHLIFSSLVRMDYDLKIVPGLAERWETPDNRTYIFFLRKGLSFHDGTPLTGEDVKFTFEHLMEPSVGSPYAAVYNNKVKKISLLDTHTIRFNLKEPTASFLTTIIMPILPRHLFSGGGDFSKRLIGSGPFRFVSQTPTEIRLEKNPGRHQAGSKGVSGIRFKVVKDPNTRFLKIKKEELDILINALPAGKIKEFGRAPLNGKYLVIEEPGITYQYLGFNMQSDKLKDVKIRKAIAFGIDVDEIIAYRLQNHAIRSSGLLSPVNWFFEENVSRYSHRPEQAERLLDQAGMTDPDGNGPESRITLELKTSNNPEVIGIARIIQAQVAKIGIRLDIKSYEWGTFYDDVKAGNFELTSMRWIGVTEPDFYYDIFHSSQIPPVGRNRGRYQNPEVDRLVQEGRVTLDTHKRKDIYSQVQKILALDLPYISLWHMNNISIVHKRVKNYRPHPQAGFQSFRKIELKPLDSD